MRTSLVALVLWLLVVVAGQGAVPTVGIEGKLEARLPGTPLVARPPDRTAPLTVRIASTRPHGTSTEYDLRYIGLVPGKYDLRAYLVRTDGTTTEDLPPLPVQIAGILPPVHQGQINLDPASLPGVLSRYKWTILGIGALWAVMAYPLFVLGRARRVSARPPVASTPPTLAERLAPLVELASAGKLDAEHQAELERLLLGHWQQRLGLEKLSGAEAMRQLRSHPEAGALLRALEDWLHRKPGTANVDINAMLAPYRQAKAAPTPEGATA